MTPTIQVFLATFETYRTTDAIPADVWTDLLIFADLCHDAGERELEAAARWLAAERKFPQWFPLSELWGFDVVNGGVHTIPIEFMHKGCDTWAERVRDLGAALLEQTEELQA